MARRLTLGQYYPAGSPVHALDPRTKIVFTLVVTVSTFFIRTPAQLAFAWASMLAVVAATHVPLRRVLRAVAPVALVVVALGVLNLLLVHDGDELARLGPLAITSGGIWAALLYPLRLVVAVMAATTLLLTTTPTALTDALDAFLAPCARVGLPGHELALVFSLMLRFIPLLGDEASSIADAQAMRGATLGEGGPVRRVRAVIPVVVALLASAVRHANDLGRALDARCYEGGATRTHWHPLRMRAADWAALALCLAYMAALVAVGTSLP